MTAIFADLASKASKSDKMKLMSALQTISDMVSSQIFDLDTLKAKAMQQSFAFILFSDVVVFVLFILAFYQLILAMEANLRENMWELGVLRSMGVTNK